MQPSTAQPLSVDVSNLHVVTRDPMTAEEVAAAIVESGKPFRIIQDPIDGVVAGFDVTYVPAPTS